MKVVIKFLFLVFFIQSNAQTNTPIFKDGDKICFIGNSITHGGLYHNFFQLYNATRFPNEEVEYYNCGIAGDQAQGMIDRFKEDILSHKPTHAFLMTGMNDINRTLYFSSEHDAENLAKQKEALDNYFQRTETLAKLIIDKGIKPIFMTPTIYDQTAELERFNDYGANDALAICAEHIRKLAKKHNAPLVDLHKAMQGINSKAQIKDPSFTIVGPDRIHPGDLGHLIMAFEIIKTVEPSEYISKMVLNLNKQKIIEAFNTDITFENNATHLEFKAKEKALPFPLKQNLQQSLEILKIKNKLNQELFAVEKLKKGNYKLLIDDIEIGTFSSKSLKKGINLAEFTNTPQYQQALKVSDLIDEYHKTQDSLRTIPFINYRMLGNYEGPNTLESKKDYLLAENKKAIGKSWQPWNLQQINKYFAIAPLEKALQTKLKKIRQKIYSINNPVWHNFKLVKI